MKTMTPTERYLKELRREQRPWLIMKLCAAGMAMLIAYIVMTADRPPAGSSVRTTNGTPHGFVDMLNR